jgi:hypothetical protein
MARTLTFLLVLLTSSIGFTQPSSWFNEREMETPPSPASTFAGGIFWTHQEHAPLVAVLSTEAPEHIKSCINTGYKGTEEHPQNCECRMACGGEESGVLPDMSDRCKVYCRKDSCKCEKPCLTS